VIIKPDWPAPNAVSVLQSTRFNTDLKGVSEGVYKGLNLGDHVGDKLEHVTENRKRFLREAGLTQAQWLTQVHGTTLVNASADLKEADGCYTQTPNLGCIVMTADCLPVLFCNVQGTKVAAVHAGWRGLASGILQKTLEKFGDEKVLVWLGPAIGAKAFEVGAEVKEQFCAQNTLSANCFVATENNKYLADLYGLARIALSDKRVKVFGGTEGTYHDSERFYSYRRDGITGRMASMIWLSSD
jgi:YfiH family protein